MKICRDCGNEFKPYPGKPGYINQCTDCATDVPKLGGNMVWAHKTAPEIEIKSLLAASIFAAQSKRLGHGVIRCITQSKESEFREGNAHKAKTGAGAGDLYFSKLGEKRSVKR